MPGNPSIPEGIDGVIAHGAEVGESNRIIVGPSGLNAAESATCEDCGLGLFDWEKGEEKNARTLERVTGKPRSKPRLKPNRREECGVFMGDARYQLPAL